MVLSYGKCVAMKVPGIGFAIRFDRQTGWVGESHIEALSEASLDRADRAKRACDEDLEFGTRVRRFDVQNDASVEAIESILSDLFACIESEGSVSMGWAVDWFDQPVDEEGFVEAVDRIDPASSPTLHWCAESAQGEWYVFGDNSISAYLETLSP